MNRPDPRVFHPLFPDLGTGPVSTQPNISPEYFELEREKIFKQSWLNVGRIEEIPNPGDYYVKDIAVLNASLVIVHGQDGTVRAFHNACPHRGNKVAEGSGNTKGFACGFHGWTFNTEGALVFVPDEEQFFDFDKNDFCLRAVNCDTWEGFIFINADPAPAQDLATYLGGMGEQLAGYPFGQMELRGFCRAEVQTNWKVFIDAFQESYHAGFVHRRSAAPAAATSDDPYAHLTSFRIHGPHRSTCVPSAPAYDPTPAEGLAFKYAQALWLAGETEQPPGTNPEGDKNWLFDINVLFPNFFVDVANGWFLTYHFWPIAVDRTLYEYRFYMMPATNAGELISREYSSIQLRDTLREDLDTVEATHKAQMSGAIGSMMFSDQEIACRHQYQVVDQIVRS